MLTGGRLAAGLLMSLATVGSMATYLDHAQYFGEDWPFPILVAAAIGFLAGWTQLGAGLGRDFLSSGMHGVGAGVVAVVFFALLFGIQVTYVTHLRQQFDDPMKLISFIISSGMRVFEALLTSRRTIATLLVGSLAAGIFSEVFNRIWR